MMEVSKTTLPGVLILRPKVFADDRGYFLESFNAAEFAKATGIDHPFVQDNESCSAKGVLRGLHLQVPPFGQAKLVRVVSGAILDVCLDVRPGSPTCGKHIKVRLDSHEKAMLYIPAGLAHGFLALEDNSILNYKCSSHRVPEAERTIRWNDPELVIDWGTTTPRLSAKDSAGLPLSARHWER